MTGIINPGFLPMIHNKSRKKASCITGGLFYYIKSEECEFPKEGNYEIKVFKYNDDELSENTKEMLRYADDSHLVSIYHFKVIYE